MKKFGMGNESKIVIGAPVEGTVVALSEVSDPTFGEEILGKGIAIIPSVGRVVAPADGTVGIIFETKHAISILTDEGTELLIHIGLDTVALKGEHFKTHVKNNDKIKKGDLLIEFDIEQIKAAGYDVITPVIVCNTADYKNIETIVGKSTEILADVLSLQK